MKNQDWEIPPNLQPDPDDYPYDLERSLRAVVGLKTYVPADAFTAGTLGTERAGSGVVIRESGLVATIGYLITEAETIWITSADGRAIPGHALAYDQESGFGLVQALGRLESAGAGAGRFRPAEGGRPGGVCRRRRAAPFGGDARGRAAGIRRLLGVRAGRCDLHRAGASVLGRLRADRRRWQADGDRFADPAAGRRQGAAGST